MDAVEVVADGPHTLWLRASGVVSALSASLATIGREANGQLRVVVVRATVAAADDESPWGASLSWLRRADLVSIAVITGENSGAGLALALACDVRIAAADATFDVRAVDLDLAGELAPLIGSAAVLHLLLTGRRLSAQRAADLGLVDVIAPPAQVDAEVSELVAGVLAHPHAAVTELKAVLSSGARATRAAHAELGAGLRLAADI